MILITETGLPIHLEVTKAGGHILRTIKDGKLYRKYTHPSRAHSTKRLLRDTGDIVLATQGFKPKTVKVRRV
jgi:hypothetical protein